MKRSGYQFLGFTVWKIAKGYVLLRWSPTQRRAAAAGVLAVLALAIGLMVKSASGGADEA